MSLKFLRNGIPPLDLLLWTFLSTFPKISSLTTRHTHEPIKSRASAPRYLNITPPGSHRNDSPAPGFRPPNKPTPWQAILALAFQKNLPTLSPSVTNREKTNDGIRKGEKGSRVCKIKLKSNLEYISSFISLFLYIYRSWMIFLDVKIIQKLIAFQRKRSYPSI